MTISIHSVSRGPSDLKRRSSTPSTDLNRTDPAYNSWESFLELWERANLIRSFIWSQESADETALFTHFLVRIRRFFKIDFCFIALHQAGGKIIQVGVHDREEALKSASVWLSRAAGR